METETKIRIEADQRGRGRFRENGRKSKRWLKSGGTVKRAREPGQLLARGWVYTGARIPSRLGEPGSLFSRYKFLQLELVVVTLLTRTRRELLKRWRTIGARIYSAASLNPASRATLLHFVPFHPMLLSTVAHPCPFPLCFAPLYPVPSFVFFFFRLLINELVSLASVRLSFFLSVSPTSSIFL